MTDHLKDLAEVRLLGFPLDVFRRSQEHWDGLTREFALLALDSSSSSHEVPAQLLGLVEALTSRYGGFGIRTDQERDDALSRGELVVDLTYAVPVHARQAAQELAAMLDQADEFCRQGQELLTLARTEDVRSFEAWYLEEFVSQLDGSQPRSWSKWSALQAGGSNSQPT